MPKEIEDYVHEIGRTGRSGKTGVATAFVNHDTAEQTLLDLKYLLLEAKQKSVSPLRVELSVCLSTLQSSAVFVGNRGSQCRKRDAGLHELWR